MVVRIHQYANFEAIVSMHSAEKSPETHIQYISLYKNWTKLGKLVKIEPKWGKSTDHDESPNISQGDQDTSIYEITGYSCYMLSKKSPETSGQRYRWMDECTVGRLFTWAMAGQSDRWRHGQMNGWPEKWMDVWATQKHNQCLQCLNVEALQILHN